MIVRYNNPNGTHGYETIDFRETAPAASNETVGGVYFALFLPKLGKRQKG